jgi:hypothetical protein
MVGSCRRHARQCTAGPGQPFSAQKKTGRRCRFSPTRLKCSDLARPRWRRRGCCCLTPKAAAPSPWLLLWSTSSALVCDHADASGRNRARSRFGLVVSCARWVDCEDALDDFQVLPAPAGMRRASSRKSCLLPRSRRSHCANSGRRVGCHSDFVSGRLCRREPGASRRRPSRELARARSGVMLSRGWGTVASRLVGAPGSTRRSTVGGLDDHCGLGLGARFPNGGDVWTPVAVRSAVLWIG